MIRLWLNPVLPIDFLQSSGSKHLVSFDLMRDRSFGPVLVKALIRIPDITLINLSVSIFEKLKVSAESYAFSKTGDNHRQLF